MTRNFLGFALASAVAMVSCTAILGGVPTSGGSGGAGDSSPGASTGARGVGGNGAAGGTNPTGGGIGGATSGGSGGGGGSGAGGSSSCRSKGETCGGGQLYPCCTGLTCGSTGTCVGASMSTSSGGPSCHKCNDALQNPMLQNSLCSVSKLKYDAIKQCACQNCPQQCNLACNGGAVSQICESCAAMSCQAYLTACTSDDDCNTCSEMLLLHDATKSDLCSGMSTTLFDNWYGCMCPMNPDCDTCATYCSSGVVSPSCAMCVDGQNSHCKPSYDACQAD